MKKIVSANVDVIKFEYLANIAKEKEISINELINDALEKCYLKDFNTSVLCDKTIDQFADEISVSEELMDILSKTVIADACSEGKVKSDYAKILLNKSINSGAIKAITLLVDFMTENVMPEDFSKTFYFSKSDIMALSDSDYKISFTLKSISEIINLHDYKINKIDYVRKFESSVKKGTYYNCTSIGIEYSDIVFFSQLNSITL